MTIKELKQKFYRDYIDYEVFHKTGLKRFHTDSIKFEYDFDENEEAIDWELMGKEEYNNTILANSCLRFNDLYEDDDKVLCILIK